MSANKSPVLLISGFDDHGTGGLFCFDGSRLEAVDRASTTGLSAKGTTIGRLLRSSSDSESSLTELLVYDGWGVVEYRRLDGILDPHDLVRLDDASWLIVSSANNSFDEDHFRRRRRRNLEAHAGARFLAPELCGHRGR